MRDGQDNIYYINGPSRIAIEYGPYVEMFKKRGVEIFYTLEPIDDFVLNHLGEFEREKTDFRRPGRLAPAGNHRDPG